MIQLTQEELDFLDTKLDKLEQASINKTLVSETLSDRLKIWSIYKKIKSLPDNKRSNMSCSSCSIGIYSEVYHYLNNNKQQNSPSKPDKKERKPKFNKSNEEIRETGNSSKNS